MTALKAIALDVDGVLTDTSVFCGPSGEQWMRFSFADMMGVSLARESGLIVTLISGEDNLLVDRFAAKMSIADITKGCKDKAVALRAFAERNQLGLDEIVFMGHDVNDVAAMKAAGVAAAPADAQPAARKIATIVTGAKGGEGAVRELVERILNA